MKTLTWLLMLWGLTALPALAVIESYEFDDETLRLRFQALSQELRCPKCQNQNIADSDAPIAKDLRQQLHRQLQGGASDKAIKQYMVDRYGEFVLYRPRTSGVTLWLWLTPVLLLLAGVAVLAAVLRRQRTSAVPSASEHLSDAEHSRLSELVGNERPGDAP